MNEDKKTTAGRLVPARELAVPTAHAGRRLDKYLRAELKGVPAALLFRLLRKGKVRVNGQRAQPNHRLAEGDLLKLPPMRLPDAIPPPELPARLLAELKESIIHEDDELIVLNKPAGLAVHVGSGVAGGVIEALRQLRPEEPDLELAHRLDRDTSGLLMVAKTPAMLRHLQEILRESGPLRRRYLALVQGFWPEGLRTVEVPLERTDTTVRVSTAGLPALTRFGVQRRFGRTATLVQAELVTGRKHQIRVHSQYAGHPIAGDPRYGSPDFRVPGAGALMFLHAAELDIPLPDGSILKVSAPWPRSWNRPLAQLSGRGSQPRQPRQSHDNPRQRPGSGARGKGRGRRPRPRS